jgi:hypothetical protein
MIVLDVASKFFKIFKIPLVDTVMDSRGCAFHLLLSPCQPGLVSNGKSRHLGHIKMAIKIGFLLVDRNRQKEYQIKYSQ